MLLQDDDGQVLPTHSVAAGLDYPGVGPEHAYLKALGRAEYVAVTDEEALLACREISRLEGLLPALETAHAVAALSRLAPSLKKDAIAIVGFSGRGDKDVPRLAEILKLEDRGG